MQRVKDIFAYVENPTVTFSRILSVFLDAMLQLISLSHAKHSNVVILYGAVFATLFAAERVSYLPEETICFPRNVVNETVRAREAPANWNTRFFHQVSRNRGESRTERRRSLPSIGDPLTLLPPRPRPITGRSLEYVARRRIDYRINRDTSAFQPALVISLHFIRYPVPSHARYCTCLRGTLSSMF